MSDQDTEPRAWELPAEPGPGTVVTDGARQWRRDSSYWWELDDAGEEINAYGWLDVLLTRANGGRVVELLPTPAEKLAARLANLTLHLRLHKRLAPVLVHHHDLQLADSGGAATALLGWALSMVRPAVRVEMIKTTAYVHVRGQLEEGNEEEVWGTVPGFQEFLAERGVDLADVPVELVGEFAGGGQR